MESTALPAATELKSGVVHLRALTGLRFLAAFGVFWFHMHGLIWPEKYLVNIGGPAVSFFFVLSGFILTFVYQDRMKWAGVPRFLFSRFVRLWPLHGVCLLLAVWLLEVWPSGFLDQQHSWLGCALQATLLQSWLPGTHWAMSFNAVAWSISVELFFYCCFPFLLLLTGKRVVGWLDIAVLLMTCGLVFGIEQLLLQGKLPSWCRLNVLVVTFPLLRLFEFVLGMATCRLMFASGHLSKASTGAQRTDKFSFVVDSLWEIVAVGSIVVACSWTYVNKIPNLIYTADWGGKTYALWLQLAGFSPLFAFAIYTFALRKGLLSRFLGSRFMVWLGEISFAFYLIHQLVLLRLNWFTMNDYLFVFYSFSISIILAAFLYASVEMPCRKFWLTVYDRKPSSWSSAWALFAGYLKSGWGRVQVACLLGLFFMLWMHPNEQAKQAAVQRVINASPASFTPARFHQEGELLGVHAEVSDRGVRLQMAWKLDRTWSRNRFLHICDPEGNILRQAKFGRKQFRNALPNESFVEEISLGRRQLKGAAYLAVGFWSEDLMSAVTDHPDAEFNRSRLNIVDLIKLRGRFIE